MGEDLMPRGANAPMEPAYVRVEAWSRSESASDRTASSEAVELVELAGQLVAPPASANDQARVAGTLESAQAAVRVVFDGEVLEVALEAHADLFVASCQVDLCHAFATGEQVLLNGYQSWTDAVERPAWSNERGLRGVPKLLVDRYALDGGGDYRFAEYSGRHGHRHGFTYSTFRRGGGVVLVGSLDESAGFTRVEYDAREGRVSLVAECPQRVIGAGMRVVLGRYAIVRGTMDGVYERYFALSEWHARTRVPLVGYTSWYRHYGDIDETKIVADAQSSQVLLKCARDVFGNRPFNAVFQIDDGFSKVGDWLDVDAEKFPHGLAPLADLARETGFIPGLWIAPFVCERESRLFKEHPDWLLRDDEGRLVTTGSHWSGGVALNTRNAEVRSYVLDVLQTVVREWGFGLLKLDFLYAACLLEHDGMNRGELMADAMELLRLGMGEDCLMIACGVPLASAFGRADYCRIGCDVGSDWDDVPYMRLLHRERVSTKNSLANTYGRAPLDGRAFGNDPDVFFLRDDVRLSAAKRDALLFGDAECASVLLTSDDASTWTDEALARYRQALRMLAERTSAR